MRYSRWLATALLGVCAGFTFADTIYLKNGASLSVDRARDKGDKVEYLMGGTTYTLPKSAVERIDSGGPAITIGPVVNSSAVPPATTADVAGLPAIPAGSKGGNVAMRMAAEPPEVAAERAALRAEITNVGQVDPVALAKIENQGNAVRTAAAYLEAGRLEQERKHGDKATSYFQQAVKFAPDSAAAREWYALSLLAEGKNSDAVIQAEHAARLAPDSPDTLRLLGITYYSSERTGDAVKAWERAVRLRPDPDLLARLGRAQRESAGEENFNQEETWHFSLRYDGQHTSLGLQRELLSTLENQYRQLARDLDYSPEQNIIVVLYTNKAFFDITQAPAWAGALNDGKLRVPVSGVQAMTPEMERVLKHELTHSFVRQMAGARVPTWLNEGLAMMEEPRSLGGFGPAMTRVFGAHKEASLKTLEYPFIGLNSQQATLAYVESLAAVEYLRSSVGMSGLQQILRRLANGDSAESALRAVNHTSYAQLQEELGAWLARTYGQ